MTQEANTKSKSWIRRRWHLPVTAIVVGTVAILVGMHGHSHGALLITDGSGQTTTVNEWRLGGSRDGVPVLAAGDVTLDLDNTDVNPHDLVVVRTDRGADELPMKNGRVDVEAAGELAARIDEAQPGESETRTITLPPGNYVFYCDLPGHYTSGMYYEVAVQ